MRILLCLVSEFHRQFSSLFDISRISLPLSLFSFFSQDFKIQIKTMNFLWSFCLNLILTWFVVISFNYADIQKLFFVLNFYFPDVYFDIVMNFSLISTRSSDLIRLNCFFFGLCLAWILSETIIFLIRRCTSYLG